MKKLLLLLSSGLLAANFAASSLAAGYGEPAMDMDKTKGDRMSMDKAKDKMEGDRMMMGWHKMTGTVDMIDHAKGMLMLKSGAADMTLHFPPDSIKDLKNGDTITVKLGFSKAKPAAMNY